MSGDIKGGNTRLLERSIAQWVQNQSWLMLIPFYMAVICLVELMGHDAGIINQYACPAVGSITLYSTPDEIIQCFGGSDIASYVRGAYALQEHGLYAFTTLGYGTWPPGFSFIELVIIKANVMPMPMALFLVSSLLWAVVLYRMYALLNKSLDLSVVLAAGIPLLLLLVPFVRDYYLWQSTLMSEPISTAIFAIAVLYLWQLVTSKDNVTTRKAIFIGILFAIAAYVRAQFDLIFHALAGAALVTTAVYYYKSGQNEVVSSRQELIKLSRGLLIVFIAYQACVLPYKLLMHKHGHAIAMASVTYVFGSVWKDAEWLKQNGAGFIAAGGGHSMCAISPEKCREFEIRSNQGETITSKEYGLAAFVVAATQPVTLIRYKLPYFWKAWGGGDLSEIPGETWTGAAVFNTALFGIILITIAVRIIQNWARGLVELVFYSALFVGATLFCFIVHFEARYLLPVKLFGVMWIMVAIVSIGTGFIRDKSIGVTGHE